MRSYSFQISILLVFAAMGVPTFIGATQDEYPPSSAAYHYSQAEKAYNEADKELNETYKLIMAGRFINIDDAVGKKMLRESQRAWINFKETNCEMYGQVTGGANNWKAAYSMDCKETITKRRVNDLKEILRSIERKE